MYVPSGAWGKLGSVIEPYLKEAGDFRYMPLEEGIELKTIVDALFTPSGFERLSRPEILKKVLEGFQVPVHNPKTGEHDFVDIAIVNKIVVDSEYVEDMISNSKIKIDINLDGLKESQQVSITASSKELGSKETYLVSLQQFEEMLYKAIHEVKDQRLEEVEEFKSITQGMVARLIQAEANHKRYLARIGEEYELYQGIGIIRDIKTSQDVGTFESFEYLYDNNKRLVNMDGVILSGRTFDDLKEKERFEFVFYSLENGILYSLTTENGSSVMVDAEDQGVDIQKYKLSIHDFNEGHNYYAAVQTAQQKKSLIEGIDESHPLYDANFEQFRQSRLDILEESKNRQKQEKLVKQFADIDIDMDF